MLRPTFSGFQVAKTGIVTSQKLLDVTGQNITNINTEGYTRQRLDLYSIPYSGGKMQYSQWYGGIGRGVNDTGASQIRDPFLDIRYRTEVAKVGREDVMATALGDLENIFDEITRDGMNTYMSKFISQLQALSQTPSDPVIESTVKSSAIIIAQMFNKYSKQIDTVQDQQITYLEDGVSNANLIMDEIATLNKQIKEQNIHEDKALELNDKRNMLIDELSQLMNIETRRRAVDIGNGVTVEEVSILAMDLQDINGDPLVIVDHDKFGSITLDKANINAIETTIVGADPADTVKLDPANDEANNPGAVTSQMLLKGELSGYLAFLNNKAEYSEAAGGGSVKDRGLQYYRGLIDTMASKFADLMNEANKPLYAIDSGNVVAYDPNATDAQKYILFEPEGGGDITAGNIRISEDWRKSTTSFINNTRLKPTLDDDGNVIDDSAANDNILYMINQMTSSMEFETAGNVELFEGTLQEFLASITTTVALQKSNTDSLYKNYGETLVAIDRSRASISGVSLDEEGINLLTYNKSFSAASRFMTTLDEALNTLINNTGRVGL